MNQLLRTVINASLKNSHKVNLVDFLGSTFSGKGAQFIGATVATEVKLVKDNPFGKITKISNCTLQVNYDYANAVQNALDKSGTGETYVPSPNAKGVWYETVTDSKGRLTPFARHKTDGTLYLRARHMSTGETNYFDESGRPVSDYLVAPYIASQPSKTTGVKPVTYKLDNILSVRYKNENYIPV